MNTLFVQTRFYVHYVYYGWFIMYENNFLSHPFYTSFLRNDFRFNVYTIQTEPRDDFNARQ